MGKFARSLAVGVSLLASTAAICVGASAASAKSGPITYRGTSYISIVHQQGKWLYGAGYSVDKLFGTSTALYVVAIGPEGPGAFFFRARRATIFTRDGSVSGTGSATEVVLPSGDSRIKNGKLSLTHGSGGLAGHRLTATFTGSYSAKTKIIIFHYRATYWPARTGGLG
jgi:hypothetical protein